MDLTGIEPTCLSTVSVRRRPSEARKLVDQIFTSSNPLISWLRQIDALRTVASFESSLASQLSNLDAIRVEANSHRCPKGNRQMRRVLNQAANAAVKAKGTIFAVVYRRIVPRLGHAQAIGAITHRLCRLIWKILHERVRYEERGPAVSAEAKKVRARKMIRELRSLGYRVDLIAPLPTA